MDKTGIQSPAHRLQTPAEFILRCVKWRKDMRAARRKLQFHPLPGNGRPLRVVHIGTDIYGGAGIGMVRLHEALLQAGVDSRILCTNARAPESGDRVRNKPISDWERKRMRFPDWLHAHGLYDTPYFKGVSVRDAIRGKWGEQFSPPFSIHRLEWTQWVMDADIVHLHWTAGFLDVPSFFRNCQKPIVWTLRDESPLLGGFHYAASIPENLSAELRRFDEKMRIIRERSIRRHGRTAFIALSDENGELARSSPTARGAEVFVVPNPLSDPVMSVAPLSVPAARKKLELPEDSKVVLFSAQHFRESRKGFDKAVDAVSQLRADGRDVILAAIGRPDQTFPLPAFVVAPGFLAPEELTDWYFAADVFVNPSTAEGCCKTLLDAVGCGTPCVAFPHSGAKEAVGDAGGIVTNGFSVADLKQGIERVFSSEWSRPLIRERALERFSPDSIAKRHIAIYLSMLSP